MRLLLLLALGYALCGCTPPALQSFNDRGGSIAYQGISTRTSDVLAMADKYCAQFNRKAQLGAPSIGWNSMNVSFACVD